MSNFRRNYECQVRFGELSFGVPGKMVACTGSSRWKWTSVAGAVVIVFALVSAAAAAKKPAPPAAAPATTTPPPKEESVIEEVSAKQLERVLNEKDYVAVFWCKYLAGASPSLAGLSSRIALRILACQDIPRMLRLLYADLTELFAHRVLLSQTGY